MASDPSREIHIEFTPEFGRNVRALAKKNPRIRTDIEPVLELLREGQILGDQIPGTCLTLFKVRVKNSAIQKGKSSGYRLIYYVRNGDVITLVTIYSKLEQGDVSAREVRRIMKEHEATGR